MHVDWWLQIPHKKLLGIQWVSNPYTGNQHISTPAHLLVVQIRNELEFGVNGTNQTKRGVPGLKPRIQEASWAVCMSYTWQPGMLSLSV